MRYLTSFFRRHVDTIIFILCLMIILGLLGAMVEYNRHIHNLTWAIVQSEETGKCYEVASRNEGLGGVMGMSEISCDYYTSSR